MINVPFDVLDIICKNLASEDTKVLGLVCDNDECYVKGVVMELMETLIQKWARNDLIEDENKLRKVNEEIKDVQGKIHYELINQDCNESASPEEIQKERETMEYLLAEMRASKIVLSIIRKNICVAQKLVLKFQ